MKDFRNIALFVVVVGAVPFFTQSGVTLNFVMTALYACLLSQAWNVLGGFVGQFSFGHALFFGTGAYVQAIAQMQWGLSPWVALPPGCSGRPTGPACAHRASPSAKRPR